MLEKRGILLNESKNTIEVSIASKLVVTHIELPSVCDFIMFCYLLDSSIVI